MIPKNITKEFVLKSLDIIDREGTPKGRNSTKYNIRYNEKFYPPKYAISLANLFANGSQLNSSVFSGGNETNTYLERLGFEIYKGGEKLDSAKKSKKGQ